MVYSLGVWLLEKMTRKWRNLLKNLKPPYLRSVFNCKPTLSDIIPFP